MNYDEFAFFNQQLAHMLRDGIPLEGALKQLCQNMRRGALSAELDAMASELANGVPLEQAVQARRLPELYVRMVQVGAAGNDLPSVLQMLADHYRQAGLVWTRLKGLLFYPVLVLVLCLAFSLFTTFHLMPLFRDLTKGMSLPGAGAWDYEAAFAIRMVGPPVVLALALIVVVSLALAPRFRRWLRWRVSPFREASLSQAASALALMLRGGCSLSDALGLLRQVERGTRAEGELARLEDALADGQSRFGEMARASEVFPPLFVWVVENSGEDIAAGFEHAAEIYQTRATHKTEMLLYGALPVSILVLGAMFFAQISSAIGPLVALMEQIGHGG